MQRICTSACYLVRVAVLAAPPAARGAFFAAASVNRATWQDPSIWRLVGSARAGPRGRLPLCGAVVAHDEKRVAFLLDVCGVDAGMVDAEGITAIIAQNLITPYNRALRLSDEARIRLQVRLLAGGGLRGLPWLTDLEKAAVDARHAAGDEEVMLDALRAGLMLALRVKAGAKAMLTLSVLGSDPDAFEALMREYWPATAGGPDPGLVLDCVGGGGAGAGGGSGARTKFPSPAAAAAARAADVDDLGRDEFDAADDGGFERSDWELFSEGRLLLPQPQLEIVAALAVGSLTRARHREWVNATLVPEEAEGPVEEQRLVRPTPRESHSQWVERVVAERKHINALLLLAGIEKPTATSPCVRVGLLRGLSGFEFTGAAEQLDTPVPFPCLGSENGVCKGQANSTTVRELLKQRTGGWSGGSSAAKCVGCGAGAFVYACLSGRKSLLWEHAGSAHCSDCPGLACCMGGRNAHCYYCGGHPFVGSMGNFPCRCLRERSVAAAALRGDRGNLARLNCAVLLEGHHDNLEYEKEEEKEEEKPDGAVEEEDGDDDGAEGGGDT